MISWNPIQSVHLTLKNLEGSVEHYYHFLLGFLVPLVLWTKGCPEDRSRKVFMRSCGIMDRHLSGIAIDGLRVIDKATHDEIRKNNYLDHTYKFIERVGYDHPDHYCFSVFSAAASELSKIFSKDIHKCYEKIILNKRDGAPSIVMINRKPPNNFYLSDRCEIQGAGESRRSIPNYHELFDSVCLQYDNVMSFDLEDKSLAFQIALFSYADIVIAQHGAALANLVWCKPDATVIEIHPSNLPQPIVKKGCFLNLATCMKLNYHRVEQEGCHSRVIPRSLLRILETVVDR